jgi:HSP20 family molecular chaperone IbpA
MFDASVQKVLEGKGIPAACLDKLIKFTERVRHKALELFEQSGRPDAHDVNRLEAEKQLPSTPRYELLETADDLDVCVVVPGFDAEEIGIVALRDSLLVRAAANPGDRKREGQLLYSEFDDQILFRRIRLPEEIDVTRVRANLDKGILRIAAPKVAEGEKSCGGVCGTCRATKGPPFPRDTQ